MKIRTRPTGSVKGSQQKKAVSASEGSKHVAFAWYREEEWRRLQELASDPDALDSSYDAWLKQAEDALAEMRANGISVTKVELDVKAAAGWCSRKGIPFNSAGRAAFTAEMARGAA
jgi:hypothetical protein